MAIASMCSESTFSVKWEDEAELIEGVDVFKYLGRMLEWSDDDWTEFLRNIWKVRQV